MIDKICKYCNKEFKIYFSRTKVNGGKYCSTKCSYLGKEKKVTINCKYCNKTFLSVPARNRKYCSKKCSDLAQRKRITKICRVCEKKYIIKNYQRDKNTYCSKKCFDVWQKENKINVGKNSPRWRDGKSFEPYTSEFNKQLKELIRFRDSYFCQKCGLLEIDNGQRLDIHHIDYNKKNCMPSNLISLCHKCNTIVNDNRSKWERYFIKKIRNEKFKKNQLNLKIAI